MNIVLTGATGGLGRAIINQLSAEPNINLVLIGRNPQKIDFEDLEHSFKGKLHFISCDFSEIDEIKKLSAEIGRYLGGEINVLINNAGIGYHCSVEDIVTEELIEVFNINVLSTILLTSALMPYFQINSVAKVIFTSSILGSSSMNDTSVYTASKHAINGFAKVLRGETLDKGISVTILEPGAIETAFIEKTNNPKTLEKFKNRSLQKLNPNVIAEWIYKIINSDNNTCPEIIRISPLKQYLQ
jgi:short-subunit dehydrogenase